MFYLLVVMVDFIIVGLMGYCIFRTWDRTEKTIFKKVNEIVHTILTLAVGFYYPLFIYQFGNYHSGILFSTAIEEFTFFGNIIIVGIAVIMVLWALSAKVRTIRNPNLLKTKNNYELFCEDFLEHYGETNKVRRKYIHTIPFGVVGLIVIICYLLNPFLGSKWFDYARFTIAVVGISFAFTFLIGDLVRLLDFSFMPHIVAGWFNKAMTSDEIDTFTSTSVMVFGFGPFLFFSFPIFLIVLLITAVADAFASIFGLVAKNRHYFPKGADSKKTIEGYIGGVISTFLCTLFGVFFAWVVGQANWSLWITFIIAGIMALLFLGIDLTTSIIRLQDNYINPLITGAVLLVILPLFNIPII
ncbi:MAG: hypothetical protein EU541_05795 [Promethearchaeota archaeon]|nr:MAG: hypothetical protein EU541_05795 [Candidatus Lokiarchaeota archaeon]